MSGSESNITPRTSQTTIIQTISKRNSLDPNETLICLQALVEELKSKNNLYDAYRVSQAMQLIRKQGEELRLMRGDVDRRAMKRYSQPEELSEYSRMQILSLVN